MRRTHLATFAASIAITAASGNSMLAQSASQATAGIRRESGQASDSTRPRPKAIEYSDAYATRLKIHRLGSYAMLPLFAAEWYLGDQLLQSNHNDWIKPAHGVVASGIGALFVVNTVTGVWNLAESRQDPAGRTRRLLHSALMIAADAGFAYTGIVAGDAGEDDDEGEAGDGRTRHKNAALVSMGISTIGTAMMWLWKD
jgi:hypothetical protein